MVVVLKSWEFGAVMLATASLSHLETATAASFKKRVKDRLDQDASGLATDIETLCKFVRLVLNGVQITVDVAQLNESPEVKHETPS